MNTQKCIPAWCLVLLGWTLFSISVFAGSGKPKPKVKWGVAIAAWSDDYLKGFEDAATLKLKGVSVRSNVFVVWKDKPQELKAILAKNNLKVPVLSSGEIPWDAVSDKRFLELMVQKARFVKAIGGKFLAVTTPKRDAYPPGSDKMKGLAESLNAVGELVKKEGVRLVLQNQMHQYCQTASELDGLMSATNPKLVGLYFDVAHFAQAGGDPSKAIAQYKKRIRLLQLKDVMSPKPGHQGKKEYNYQFTILGKGNRIDFDAVLSAIKKAGFKGWCMLETEETPVTKISPLDATKASLKYLTETYLYGF
ncbi:MAG TPA: sugar phosphate isomerase/epimerase family protein [Catalimonadaceae bacterium]|nr:sugar phosphate isomerase/epimerase family protein [Catalimonadaceae bacterium]HPI10283.1 sugar phosphate isomerase/epimerase family protein [Catalimonadaceae bacterium]